MPPLRLAILAVLAVSPSIVAAQQSIDSVYSARIKELTPTDPRWKFTTEMVETLPASSTVPTPLKVNHDMTKPSDEDASRYVNLSDEEAVKQVLVQSVFGVVDDHGA